MDDTQNTSSELTDLQTQCQWLRKQLQVVLLLLILVSGTLTLFLWRQVKYTSQDLKGVRPVIEEYNKTSAPAMEDFVKKVAEYGRTHPDFAAIYNKYGLGQLNQSPVAPAPKK